MNAVESFQEIKQFAEKIKNDDDHFVEVMDVGDCWVQGDVYIKRIGALPKGCKNIAKPMVQLAPGTTMGSRHCLASLAGITMYTNSNATELDGPIIEAENRLEVTHPEHGNVNLPSGIYCVTYQRTYADELRRVRD